MKCVWESTESGMVRCPQCGVLRPNPRTRVCRPDPWKDKAKNPAELKPSVTKKALNYAAAWTRWALKGMPTRDENQIREILAICVKCDHYDPQGEACNECGCCTNARTQGWANKIAMATEKCPLEKW